MRNIRDVESGRSQFKGLWGIGAGQKDVRFGPLAPERQDLLWLVRKSVTKGAAKSAGNPGQPVNLNP